MEYGSEADGFDTGCTEYTFKRSRRLSKNDRAGEDRHFCGTARKDAYSITHSSAGSHAGIFWNGRAFIPCVGPTSYRV